MLYKLSLVQQVSQNPSMEKLHVLKVDLEERQEPYKYVIPDDDSDMLDTQRNNFIHTDWKVGLTEENVNKAIEILNGMCK